MKPFVSLLILSFLLSSCNREDSKKSIFIPKDIVIAHRGTTYWAPEETEMAYRWARNMGAHYLEVDIQRSKDGVLLALHDDQLTRTTNIEDVFPERALEASSHFSFEELMCLDAGSWFLNDELDHPKDYYHSQIKLSKTNQNAIAFNVPDKYMVSPESQVFIGGRQGVATLEDVVRIAEGFRIAKDSLGHRLYQKIKEKGIIKYVFYYVKDPMDEGHRPGLYIETKEPHLFHGIEEDLYTDLAALKWNVIIDPDKDTIMEENGQLRVGETSAKVILQTFSLESLRKLNQLFKGKLPTAFLLWLGDSNMPKNDSIIYHQNLEYAKKMGVQIIAPSIGGSPNNYQDLLTEKNYQWIREYGFLIHPYSFDTPDQMLQYGPSCDGMFTNRAELTKEYYKNNK